MPGEPADVIGQAAWVVTLGRGAGEGFDRHVAPGDLARCRPGRLMQARLGLADVPQVGDVEASRRGWASHPVHPVDQGLGQPHVRRGSVQSARRLRHDEPPCDFLSQGGSENRLARCPFGLVRADQTK